ncbi:hypothetical protein ACFQ08_09690, partial [Streptosporangium algeriense]
MNRKTGRGNRIGLLIMGVLLLLLGGYTLARGAHTLPRAVAPGDEPLVNDPVRAVFAAYSPWLWWLVALAAVVLALAPRELRSRLRVTCVDVAPRPPGLPEEIGWERVVPEGVEGLVIANEWLDNVPLDVVEQTSDGPRLVMVDPSDGAERLGDIPEEADLAWLDRWWPLGP